MSFFILLHLLYFSIILYYGILVYKKYRKTSGAYFLLFSVMCSLWFLFYVTVFSGSYDKDVILLISRVMHSMSLIGMYSMLLFVFFFNKKKTNNYKYADLIIAIIFVSLFIIGSATPLIVSDMKFVSERGDFLEIYGVLYSLFEFLYLSFIPLFLFTSYVKIKELSSINRNRLKSICFGFFFFTSFSIIILVLFPIFGIIIIEKYQILFLTPFLFSLWYSINRYYFLDIKMGLGVILIYILALSCSIFSVNILKNMLFSFGDHFKLFWGVSSNFGIFDLLLGIVIFIQVYKILSKYLPINSGISQFSEKLGKIKDKIPYVTNIIDLNRLLLNEFNNSLKIEKVRVNLLKNKKNNELYKYFSKYTLSKIFLNDIVFIEENKNKFNYKKIKSELNKGDYLSITLTNNNGNIIGFFNIGRKLFNDSYTIEEIESLKNFASCLEGHLKYIEIYSKIYELNLNLDKKVDEKTIEYNNLINKQKEFISLVSHEIKGPLTGAIFQVDCLIDDINSGEYDKKYLNKELSLLNDQLLKSGDLVNQIFSIQKFDSGKVELFKENIHIGELLNSNIQLLIKQNKGVKFNVAITKNVGFIEIDKIQFNQVIDNLLNNAIKFADPKDATIQLSARKKEEKIIISIEDNGKGFIDADLFCIFDKYSTGVCSSRGLGLGLYLCKKIVELHNGEITPHNSKQLGGAKFVIKIPI